MDQIRETINQKKSIILSRNTPVAFVVGAASFLGSHVVDKLLEKGIQVIGIDDLTSGQKENLQKATHNRNFHLLIKSPDEIDVEVARLDYLIIDLSEGYNLVKVLELFKKTQCKCLFISSIDLYDSADNENLGWLKSTESKIAKFAQINNLNARILRLGPVFGPRMDFKNKDPLIRLIAQALTGDLQKQIALDFSSRALYIEDAVDLIIRTVFSGATSQKIFDGVSSIPYQVSEVKQILLDPIWYETRDFTPSELPPWPTPNLDKTIKTLNWRPKQKLVANLRITLSYFKDNEIAVPKDEERPEPKTKKEEGWSKEKKETLEAFKQSEQQKVKLKTKKGPKLPIPLSKIYLILLLVLITYALIWPSVLLGWGIFTFRHQLNAGLGNLQKGEFENSLENINEANGAIGEVKSIVDGWEPIRRLNVLQGQFELVDNLINLSTLSVTSSRSTVRGIQALLQSVKAVTGELNQSPAGYFGQAQLELTSATEDLSAAYALVKSEEFNKKLPSFLSPEVGSLTQKLGFYSKLADKAKAISVLLPKLVALEGNRDYLLLLQNNMELRPAGGFIGSFAKVSFEGGKLKTLVVNDTYAIDGNLNIHVEPPKEIKEDLGQKDWFLRDANWESDFPTSARQAQWFYTKETGERIEGVIALDISAMEELLAAIGPLDLPDYNEKITSENLFQKAVTHAEVNFFPGSQAKKSFLTALTNGVLEKVFFLPQNHWSGIISALGKSLDEKHISIYLNDPQLFSYVLSQNWAHLLPRESDQNKNQDFLSIVEANLGANKVNYYLDRKIDLETVVGKMGEVRHRLRINYTNRSPSDTFPAGRYKNRMRVYLPFSSKLTKALWGEADITKNVTSFVDYGRSGYSLLIELLPKEQKTLVLDYSVPVKLELKGGKAAYRLDIIKQAGTLKDPLTWTISYPINYQLVSDKTEKIGPQEEKISTDLSSDRSFQVEFKQ